MAVMQRNAPSKPKKRKAPKVPVAKPKKVKPPKKVVQRSNALEDLMKHDENRRSIFRGK